MALSIILTILATLHSQVKLPMVVQSYMLGEGILNLKEYNTGGFKRIEGLLTSGTTTVLLKTVRSQVAFGVIPLTSVSTAIKPNAEQLPQ